MSKFKFNQMFKELQRTLDRNSPAILTGIGIAGMITTAVLAVNATPKAMMLIDREIARQNREIVKKAAEGDNGNCCQITKLKPLEVTKVAWKCYIPAVITCIASTACLVGANSVNTKRNAALATAYTLTERALTEFKEKTLEVVGEEKNREINDRIAQDKVDRKPIGSAEVIVTGTGTTLCYDSLSGRYFDSDINTIKAAKNEINRILINEMCASLNEFYDELGLSHTQLGEELGWGFNGTFLDIDFGSAISEDDRPCIVLNYSIAPKRDFYKLM